MLETPPKTNSAFVALLDALDVEIKELQVAGQRRFHEDGEPRSARLLTQAAIERQQLRADVVRLHAKWNDAFPRPMPIPTPDPRGSLEIKPREHAKLL